MNATSLNFVNLNLCCHYCDVCEIYDAWVNRKGKFNFTPLITVYFVPNAYHKCSCTPFRLLRNLAISQAVARILIRGG
jgi:hypothetical protein